MVRVFAVCTQTFHALRATIDLVFQPILVKLPRRTSYVGVTVGFVGLSAIVGVLVPNVTVVLGYKGTLGYCRLLKLFS